MRKISATYVFPISAPPVKNGIVVCKNDGTILEIIDNKGVINEEPGLEYYSGILTPGFVNTHCHLELSHLQNKIEEKTGIGDFIGKIYSLRKQTTGEIINAAHIADKKMWATGTAAVGDISNTEITCNIKQNSKIYYHTFVESFGFHPSRAQRAFTISQTVFESFQHKNLAASIVPHSPYSVSEPLFQKIIEHAQTNKCVLSMHNQESSGEKEFFEQGSGPIARHIKNNLGIDISHWQPTGKSSLQSVLSYFPKNNSLLLVHNTNTQKDDIVFLKNNRSTQNTYFTLCPNSNIYIENQLPPVPLFQSEKLTLCIGTDSLASNHSLSVLEELKTLQFQFPELNLNELLKWGTLNGAKALNIETIFGSFDTGKKPGINLITGIDFNTFQLNKNSKVKRLL